MLVVLDMFRNKGGAVGGVDFPTNGNSIHRTHVILWLVRDSFMYSMVSMHMRFHENN